MAITLNGTTGIDAGASLEADAITLAGATVATQAYADAVTPAALSTATGSAPSYSARAWVNFNGTGTVAIRASGNVSSITDNGTGDYTVNFTTAMSDANYAVITGASTNSNPGTGAGFNMTTKGSATQTTTSTRQLAGVQNGAYDVYYCFVAIMF